MDVSTVSPSTSTASRDTASTRAATTQSGSSAASSGQTATTASSDSSTPPGGPPYTSPVVGFDTGTGKAILQFRDQTSGQLQFQLPSRTALQYAEAVATSPGAKSINGADKSGGDVLA